MKTADTTSLPKEFGARCKELRGQAGMSQLEFAEAIGMDRSYYASIETGARNVTLQSCRKIADGFDITLAQLLEGVGEKKEPISEASVGLDESPLKNLEF